MKGFLGSFEVPLLFYLTLMVVVWIAAIWLTIRHFGELRTTLRKAVEPVTSLSTDVLAYLLSIYISICVGYRNAHRMDDSLSCLLTLGSGSCTYVDPTQFALSSLCGCIALLAVLRFTSIIRDTSANGNAFALLVIVFLVGYIANFISIGEHDVSVLGILEVLSRPVVGFLDLFKVKIVIGK